MTHFSRNSHITSDYIEYWWSVTMDFTNRKSTLSKLHYSLLYCVEWDHIQHYQHNSVTGNWIRFPIL